MGEWADNAVDDSIDNIWGDLEGGGWLGPRSQKNPLSAPAGSPLARARMRAHQAFDRLWEKGPMTRKQAYKWLARSMGIPRERCHMVMFNEGDCAEVVRLCSLEALAKEKD